MFNPYKKPAKRRIKLEKRYKNRTSKFGTFTKEYVLSITKIITDNNCWISDHKPKENGYINVTINKRKYYLHRVVLCLWNDIDYNDHKILALHKCNNNACFNPEHIKPGTKSDNAYDSIRTGTHANSNKERCPKCGREFKIVEFNHRVCLFCANEPRKLERQKERERTNKWLKEKLERKLRTSIEMNKLKLQQTLNQAQQHEEEEGEI